MNPLEDYQLIASPPFVSKDQKGLKTLSLYSFPEGVGEDAGSASGFGDAEEFGAVSTCAEVGGGEVASSWSSMTLAFTIAAEDE